MDFDLNTGTLSDPEQLPFIGSEAFEFSHNSQYLYATSTGLATGTQQLVRYNLVTAFEQGVSVASTQEVIAPDITAYYMQMAPDMNIYYTWFDFLGTSHIGAINCANSDSPSVTPQAFSYNSGFDLLFFRFPISPHGFFMTPISILLNSVQTLFICAKAIP